MLVLKRHVNEEVVLLVGEELIRLRVLWVHPSDFKVRLGFDASPNVVIRRREVHDAIERQQAED